MIVPLVVLATFLARISAQDIDLACVQPLASYQTCTAALSKDCPDGKTLFDVLDPAELCTATVGTTTCGAALASTTKALDNQGCCTLNSLYPAMAMLGGGGNCSTSEELSYEGFSQTVSYFCENQPYADNDFYCLKDGQAYIQEIKPYLEASAYAFAQGDTTGAAVAFAPVDCNKLQATQCCYPSIKEFIEGCGDATAQLLLPQLNSFLQQVPQACAAFKGVTVNFNNICADLTEIEHCFASSDPNCVGGKDDDDAAFSVMPTLASVFAAIAGFLFFARQL